MQGLQEKALQVPEMWGPLALPAVGSLEYMIQWMVGKRWSACSEADVWMSQVASPDAAQGLMLG